MYVQMSWGGSKDQKQSLWLEHLELEKRALLEPRAVASSTRPNKESDSNLRQ